MINELKRLNITLFDCLSGNFIFLGETISLFLFVYFQILNNFHSIKNMKKEINFILNEIKEFIIDFYKFYKNKEITKDSIIYKCFKSFFILLVNNFYNKIKFLNDKKDIYQEFNLLKEIVQFLYDKNDGYKKNMIYIYYIQKYKTKNEDIIESLSKEKSYIINKIMEIIIDKKPDIFIEVSDFFRKYNITNNIISEVNLLIKKKSNIIFPYISYIYSLINSSELNQNKSYNSKTFYKPFYSLNQLKNFMNTFLIKKILFLLKNINNINEEINLSEQDIFRNKKFSIKLLDYSLPNEKMNYIINKINNLYFEEKYENLFLEVIK